MSDSPSAAASEAPDPEPDSPPDAAPDADEAPSAEAAGAADSEEQIAALRREVEEATDLARRAQADFLNVQRRSHAERSEFRSRAIEEVCRSLLPVLDDLELAVAGARQTNHEGAGGEPEAVSSELQALQQGVGLVQRRFIAVLARLGLVEVEADGAAFDPRLHDAVLRAPAGPGQEEGQIVEVFRRGYSLDGRVIRPATVVVASAPEDEAGTGADGPAEDESPDPDANGRPRDEGEPEPQPAHD